MLDRQKRYMPEDIGDVLDHLELMLGPAPKFDFSSHLFPNRNIDSEFYVLNEGLTTIRNEVGEEIYTSLSSLSNRMRAHFEADPDDKNGETSNGIECLHEMYEILNTFLRLPKH